MASGKITLSTPSGSSMSGYISWSSKSNGSAANTSTVTATVYLKKNNSYTTTGTFSGTLSIAGTSYSISKYGSWKNSYVAVGTKTKTVAHNSDGSKSIKISTSIKNSGTSQAGTYSASKTVTLDTIPRASSISSSADWTAGNDLKVSISRKSTSFTHKVSVSVGETTVASAEGVGTSVTFSGDAFNSEVFKAMKAVDSAKTKITVTTYSGSTKIGSAATKTGTVSVPTLSSITCTNEANIKDTIDIIINQGNSRLTHSLSYSFGSMSGMLMGSSTAGVSVSEHSWYVDEQFYSQIPNAKSGVCTLTLLNYYTPAGESPIRVGQAVTKKVTLNAADSDPIFSDFTYMDTNDKLHAYTGSNQVIVSGYSNVKCVVEESNKAVAINGATMTSYEMNIGSKSTTCEYIDIGNTELIVEKANAGIISIKAMDSRGNYTTVTKEAIFIPYFPLSIKSMALERENMAGEKTMLTMELSMFGGSLGITNNIITSCTYRYKEAGSEWSEENAFNSINTSEFEINADNGTAYINVEIAGDKGNDGFTLAGSYDVEVYVSDAIESATAVGTIDSGYPAIYIKKLDGDEDNGYQVGINCVPDESQGSGLFVEGKSMKQNGLDIGVPVGSVMGWFSNTIPMNWLLLDGRAISRVDYADLFSAIGTTYGTGDGSTTFNLPDMRDRTAVGKGSNTLFATLGKTGGETTHKLVAAEIPAHTHGSAGTHKHFIKNTNGTGSGYIRLESYASAASTNRSVYTDEAGAHTHTSVGGSGAHNNVQPYIVLNYIIKAK